MTEQEEKIIRGEAKEFCRLSIKLGDRDVMKQVGSLRNRLFDFYTDNIKALFLDEICISLEKELQTHRDKAHGGQASETCGYEQSAERILFYIRQEIAILPSVVHKSKVLNQSRTKVFISYSHADDNYLKEMQRHFKPFEKQVEFWSDQKIQAGAKWKDEIEKALNETKIAIFLVSADFFASDFIMSDELPKLLKAAEEEGATVLSIVLKPCAFGYSPLSQYQAINSPDTPLLGMSELEKEQVYVNVLNQVLNLLN